VSAMEFFFKNNDEASPVVPLHLARDLAIANPDISRVALEPANGSANAFALRPGVP
jgi:hypothetical protein